ncbi:MAG TPA: hypothetical protein VN769_04740 [Xanthobacteraceae bacterium]|nr:hypothetical protein [Xanthobacteraceae bacterium]
MANPPAETPALMTRDVSMSGRLPSEAIAALRSAAAAAPAAM